MAFREIESVTDDEGILDREANELDRVLSPFSFNSTVQWPMAIMVRLTLVVSCGHIPISCSTDGRSAVKRAGRFNLIQRVLCGCVRSGILGWYASRIYNPSTNGGLFVRKFWSGGPWEDTLS